VYENTQILHRKRSKNSQLKSERNTIITD